MRDDSCCISCIVERAYRKPTACVNEIRKFIYMSYKMKYIDMYMRAPHGCLLVWAEAVISSLTIKVESFFVIIF